MSFLIIKIFVYLVLASVIGFGAGWLYRNWQSRRTTAHSQRVMYDAKAKVLELESLLQGRDDQFRKLKFQIKQRREELQVKEQELGEKEREILEQRRQLYHFVHAQGAAALLAVTGEREDEVSDPIAELLREIATLKTELEATGNRPTSEVQPTMGAEALETEVLALREQTARLDTGLKEASADLVRQRENVSSLEHERELQNKLLKVLHQQLQLARANKPTYKFESAGSNRAANI